MSTQRDKITNFMKKMSKAYKMCEERSEASLRGKICRQELFKIMVEMKLVIGKFSYKDAYVCHRIAFLVKGHLKRLIGVRENWKYLALRNASQIYRANYAGTQMAYSQLLRIYGYMISHLGKSIF